jgi:hypothetical protein
MMLAPSLVLTLSTIFPHNYTFNDVFYLRNEDYVDVASYYEKELNFSVEHLIFETIILENIKNLPVK